MHLLTWSVTWVPMVSNALCVCQVPQDGTTLSKCEVPLTEAWDFPQGIEGPVLARQVLTLADDGLHYLHLYASSPARIFCWYGPSSGILGLTKTWKCLRLTLTCEDWREIDFTERILNDLNCSKEY